jgi:hypothetical protein
MKEDGMAGHVARMIQVRNSYRILVRKTVVKRPLEKSRCRREDNIKMDVMKIR